MGQSRAHPRLAERATLDQIVYLESRWRLSGGGLDFGFLRYSKELAGEMPVELAGEDPDRSCSRVSCSAVWLREWLRLPLSALLWVWVVSPVSGHSGCIWGTALAKQPAGAAMTARPVKVPAVRSKCC